MSFQAYPAAPNFGQQPNQIASPYPPIHSAPQISQPISVNQTSYNGGANQDTRITYNLPINVGVPFLPSYAPSTEPAILKPGGPGYGGDPYGMPPSYGQPPSYGGDPYGMPPSYGQPPSYGGDPYGMPPSYGQPPSYGGDPYGLPPSISSLPPLGLGGDYGIGGGYPTPNYPMEPPYAPEPYPPKQDDSSAMFMQFFMVLLLSLISKLGKKDDYGDDYVDLPPVKPRPKPPIPDEPPFDFPPEPPVDRPKPPKPKPVDPFRPKPGKGGGHSVGDPHFKAFNGDTYDYQGAPDQIVNYIESNALRLNSKFKKWANNTTVNGEWFASLVKEDGKISKLSYNPNDNKLTLDGKEIKDGEEVTFKSNLKAKDPETGEVKPVLHVIKKEGDKVNVVSGEYAFTYEDKGENKDFGSYGDFTIFSTTEKLGIQLDGHEDDPGFVSITASKLFKGVIKNGANATHYKLDLNGDGKIDPETEHVAVEDFIVKGDDPFGGAKNQRLGEEIDEANVQLGVGTDKDSSSK